MHFIQAPSLGALPQLAMVASTVVLICSCGGGGGSSPSVVFVGGSVQGLAAGSTLGLSLDGGPASAISQNGPYRFAAPVAIGATYTVTITSLPSGQTCWVSSSSSVVWAALVAVHTAAIGDVPGIDVSCAAESDSVVHTFAADSGAPSGPLVLASDGAMYGTTGYGGPYGASSNSVVYRLTVDGSYSVVYTLPAPIINPESALVAGPDGRIYGATGGGGLYGKGTVFSLTPNGPNPATYSLLYSFGVSASDGAIPVALSLGPDGNLYGATYGGGANGTGTVFRMTPGGVLTTLYEFESQAAGSGIYPIGVVAASDGSLFGATSAGGADDIGVVYRLAPSGGYSVLHTFASPGDGEPGLVSLRDGPSVASDGTLFGARFSGGANGTGAIYRIKPDGAYDLIYSFGPIGSGDGYYPNGSLLIDTDGSLYGTTSQGGHADGGTAFVVRADGSETRLHSFATNYTAWYPPLQPWDASPPSSLFLNPLLDGCNPFSHLVRASDGKLYGLAGGGKNMYGVLFRIN
jgi:uncharacterized repeat protein (TIGR03803 family)